MRSDVKVSVEFGSAESGVEWRQRMNHSAEDLGMSLRLYVMYYQNRSAAGTSTGGDMSSYLKCGQFGSEECVGHLRRMVLLVQHHDVNESSGSLRIAEERVDLFAHFVTDSGSREYVFVVEVGGWM